MRLRSTLLAIPILLLSAAGGPLAPPVDGSTTAQSVGGSTTAQSVGGSATARSVGGSAMAQFVGVSAAARRPRGNAVTQTEPAVIRVLTYNIRHGEGRDGRIDLTRIADVMKSAQPDIIALQEVDRGTDRSGREDQVAELARQMGMHAEFGKAISYGGGEYGVAVLSRWPLERPENRPLPSSPGNEQRTSLTVLVRAGEQGPILRFTSTHLGQSRGTDDRLAQAAHLHGLLAADDGVPSILAGDFNARTGTDVMQILEGDWTNAAAVALPATSPANAPTTAQAGPPSTSRPNPPATSQQSRPPTSQVAPQAAPSTGPSPQTGRGRGGGRGRGRGGPRNDYVLLRPAEHWRVIEATFLDDNQASDHRPVLTVLEWAGAPLGALPR